MRARSEGGRTPGRAAAVEVLQERLGWRFRDQALLEQALTHASVGDRAPGAPNNERLEFLGDRVLNLLLAEALFHEEPPLAERELHLRHMALINRDGCAEAARAAELGPALRVGDGEGRSGGRRKDVILADACEAVLAAVYLDGGLEAARAVVARLWGEQIARSEATPGRRDVKGRLQEWAQGAGRPLPDYQVTGRSGPAHASSFSVQVSIAGLEPATGEGSSRQAAEKAAAAALLAREGVA